MYRCSTKGCARESIDNCSICVECMEEAALENQRNFGTPECYICGNCGDAFLPDEFVGHICEFLNREE